MWPSTSCSSFATPRPLTVDEHLYLTDVLCTVFVLCTRSLPQISGPLFGTIGPFEVDHQIELPLYVAEALHRYCAILPPAWLTPARMQGWLDEEQRFDDLLPPPHPRYIELTIKVVHQCDSVKWENDRARNKVMVIFDLIFAIRRRKVRDLDCELIDNLTVNTTNMGTLERSFLSLNFATYIRQVDAPTEAPLVPSTTLLKTCYGFTELLREHEQYIRDVKEDYGLI